MDRKAKEEPDAICEISKICANFGKHTGTGHFHICRRCAGGEFPKGCADFKICKKGGSNE